MSVVKNKNLFASLAIALIVSVLILSIWIFGGSVYSAIATLTVPENAAFAIWKLIPVAITACTFGLLTEKYALKRIFPFASAFSIIWFIVGIVFARFLEIDLVVIPTILVTFFTMVFVHTKKLWEIDRDLTDKLVSLASTDYLSRGLTADSRIESSLKLLETIFPVSEVIVFRYELNGDLNPIGRKRKDNIHNSLASRQNAWRKCVGLCEKALESRETHIQKDEDNKDAAQIALPLIFEDVLIGVLFVDVGQDFEDEDKNLLESFSRQLARNFQRQELSNKQLPHNAWWGSFSTQSLENRLDITKLVQGILKEQTFSAMAGSYLREAHAIAYLDGTLAFVNRQMKIMANLNPIEMQDLDLFSLLGRFKTEVFNEPSLAIRRVMQTGDSFKCELDFNDEKETLSMEITLVKVAVESDKIHDSNVPRIPACFLITFRNISAVKENEKLRSDMTHLMSHELRTPITSIQGFAEMLLLEDEIPEDSKDFLQTIADESMRASKILTNFLSVSNLQQSDKQEVIKTPVEVNNVVQEVVEDYIKPAKEKRIRLIDKRGKDIPPIAADKGLITKALSHLLDNAIRYSPERTSIIISTILETDFLRVEVEDRGYGIPKGEQEKIWQKFYRVARDGHEKDEDTTGLGLSLVKEIIEQHNGEVELKSIEGKGSRFGFKLPRL